MNVLVGTVFFCIFLSRALSLNCYTCLNKRLHECIKSNQTCGYGMNKCFSMQKEATDGGYRYTKFCADEWYCERYDAACDDLDEPEYSYMECNVGCCTSHLCNDAVSRTCSSLLLVFLIFVAFFKYW